MDAPILRFDPQHRFDRQSLSCQPAVSLEITRGRAKRKLRDVAGPVFLIGTSPDCDLVLGDPRFPESYAYLFVQRGKVTIRWLGSGPPLEVGGERLEAAELCDRDIVGFGSFEVRVLIRRPPGGPLASFVRGPHRMKTDARGAGTDDLA